MTLGLRVALPVALLMIASTLEVAAQTPTADIRVLKSDSKDPVPLGTTFAYFVNATNLGPSAGNIAITDQLPSGVKYLSHTTSAGSCTFNAATKILSCSASNVAVGTTIVVKINVEATTPGTWINRANATTNRVDPVPANNAATNTTTILPRVANLSIEKTDSPDPVLVGAILTYTLNATNAGPQTSAPIRIRDALPPGVQFVSVDPAGDCDESGGVVTCDLGPLAANESVEVEIQVRPLVPGLLLNRANVTTRSNLSSDPDQTDNQDTATTLAVLTAADLRVEKEDSKDPVAVNEQFTYRVVVENKGPGDALNVTVQDALPAGFVLTSFESDNLLCAENNGTLICTNENLSAGEFGFLNFTGSYSSSGLKTNRVNVTADNPDPAPTNNTAIETTNVAAVRPGAPTGLECDAEDNGIRLDWNDAANATSYNIYRKTGDGSFQKIGSSTESRFFDTNVEEGVSYTYRVTAVNTAGESAPSGTCEVTAIPFFPVLILGALAVVGAVVAYVAFSRRKS